MNSLIGYEMSREGNFTIPTLTLGRIQLFSETKRLVIFGQSEKPKDDFSFNIPIHKDGKHVSDFYFDYSSIESDFYGKVELKSQEFKLNIKIAVSTPYERTIEGPHIDVPLPKHFTIGHRGSGSNQAVDEFLENSLPGFRKAYKRGAEVVEFDIQLAKDSTPIIFHDFFLKRDEKYPGIEPVKVEEGKYLYSFKQLSVQQHHDSGFDTKWNCPRPTYKDLMTRLPPFGIFDIEIKYPFEDKNADVIYDERNKFLHRILDEMVDYMGNRPGFFSTFDPIVCTMLAVKQKKWDVYQLMSFEEGENLYDFYVKVKSFAPLHKQNGIKGFVFNAEHILQLPQLVKELKDMGFKICTYGSPNNDPENIVLQLNIGVSGICADEVAQCVQTIKEYDEKYENK